MLTTIRNAWKIPELRRKLLFTLVIILLYRIGNVIPVPGVNVQQMSLMFSQQLSNTIFGLFDMMSGSAFSQATIFALSIQPYINASIIIQLLTIAIPALERLSKEGGEEGKKMITSIFAFDDMLAYEVMTPRTDVFCIDINAPTEEYIDEMMELRYSRIPVYEDDSDNIIGILY